MEQYEEVYSKQEFHKEGPQSPYTVFYMEKDKIRADIGLSKWLIKTLTECAITSPTDVQNATIEPTLEGRGFYSEFLNVFSSWRIQKAGNVLL